MNEQLARIKEKITRIKELENKHELFGAGGHGFELNEPLSPTFINEIESREGIDFPEEYREFITHVCDGGFGPYYGLYSLEESFSVWDVKKEKPINVLDEQPYQDRYLVLSHEGCGYYVILSLNGEYKGRLWSYLRAADETMYPLKSNFLDWYEAWLNYALESIKQK